MSAQKRNFNDIKNGDTASFTRRITAQDVTAFASISGDYNPLHMDEHYAATSIFSGRVVHGMLLGALVSRLVGMELPGEKALLLKECLEFKKPVRIGDQVMVKGSVAHKSEASRLIEISIEIKKEREVIAAGSAHVRVLK